MSTCTTAPAAPQPTNLLADCLLTIGLNLALFPGLAWLFYHGKTTLDGAIVATEIFFGGVICTLVVGTTGHFIATKDRTCRACAHRNNCPFLAIFILGLVIGVACVTASHFTFGNDPVPFGRFIIAKFAQGLALGIVIPVCMDRFKLII